MISAKPSMLSRQAGEMPARFNDNSGGIRPERSIRNGNDKTIQNEPALR
jgi:hypothetical protein